MIWRLIQAVLAAAFVAVFGLWAWRYMETREPPALAHARAATLAASCAAAPEFAEAAAANRTSLTTAPWSAFGRSETGWEIYAPLTGHEIRTSCPPDAAGFAKSLAAWQAGRGLKADGVMDEATLKTLRTVWLLRRPFVVQTRHGACPLPPPPDSLTWLRPEEGFEGKRVQLLDRALAAYREMIAAARSQAPALDRDHRLLTIFSGYRDPAADDQRCLETADCGSPARANCSAHRTGLAVDLYLGSAPGYAQESSADPNRLFQTRTPAYRWLTANAGRFGFVNYPFEPWHWEWAARGPDDPSGAEPPAR